MHDLTTGQLAKRYGVTPQTIRRWIKAGKFEHVSTTHGKHIPIGQPAVATIGYVRVSSAKQRDSLSRQAADILKQHPGIEVVSDIGSGFNFKRRQFVKLLERSLQGDAITVVVSDQDRLARTGFEFIRFIMESSGGSVVAVHQDGNESGSFNTAELVGFITSFCNSYYGKRSSRRKKDSHLSGK